MVNKQLIIEKFEYNGFYVKSFNEIADYTGTFVEWTNDPGIAVVDCSDGTQRLIPSCCFSPVEEGVRIEDIIPTPPELNPFEGKGVFFGMPRSS